MTPLPPHPPKSWEGRSAPRTTPVFASGEYLAQMCGEIDRLRARVAELEREKEDALRLIRTAETTNSGCLVTAVRDTIRTLEEADADARRARIRRTPAGAPRFPVHNHGPHEGAGLACREQLVGECMIRGADRTEDLNREKV